MLRFLSFSQGNFKKISLIVAFIEQMQNVDSTSMQPPKLQSAVFHHHHQQQALGTVDPSQPCGCTNCVNTLMSASGLNSDMRLPATVSFHSSVTPSFRQMSCLQSSDPVMTANDTNRLLSGRSGSGMQLPMAGSSVHCAAAGVGYTPSACSSSRAAVNQSHQPVGMKLADGQFMRQVGEVS